MPDIRGGVGAAAHELGEVAGGDPDNARQIVPGDVALLEERPRRVRLEPDPQRVARVPRFAPAHRRYSDRGSVRTSRLRVVPLIVLFNQVIASTPETIEV